MAKNSIPINPIDFVGFCVRTIAVLAAAHSTLALIGLLTGVVIGLTGMGGGALLTPILVLGVGIDPGVAVSSDVVLSLIIKPFGVGVHAANGTVRPDIVAWLAAGSVPTAFLAAVSFHALGWGESATEPLKLAIGIALLIAALGQLARLISRPKNEQVGDVAVRPFVTLGIGAVGGSLVGLTSVGSGSLMLVLLSFAYPQMSTKQLIGTDLAQAVPLVAAAALGHWLFGAPSFGLIGWLLIGAIPGVLIGSRFSARTPDRVTRPILGVVLASTGLKLVGLI